MPQDRLALLLFMIVILAGCTQPALITSAPPTPAADPRHADTRSNHVHARNHHSRPGKQPRSAHRSAILLYRSSQDHRQQPLCPVNHRGCAGWRAPWGRFRLLHPPGHRKSHAGRAHPGGFTRPGCLGIIDRPPYGNLILIETRLEELPEEIQALIFSLSSTDPVRS